MSDDLVCEMKGPVAYLVINREERSNAISLEMISDLLTLLQEIGEYPVIRAVCVTGAGDKVFCSGADLGLTLGKESKDRIEGAKKYAELLKKMSTFEKPLVAKVNGACLAGGLGLMLSCDIVIARNDTYFCTPEVNVGLFPMMIGALLFRNVGIKKAMDMVLTGRKIPASEAEVMGLITKAVPPEKLDEEVDRVMELLCEKSPIAIQLGKDAFRNMADMPFENAVDYLCEAFGKVISTEDAAEGMQAFLEKRKPQFKGC